MSVDILDMLVLCSECMILSPDAEEYTSFGCLKSVQLVSDYTPSIKKKTKKTKKNKNKQTHQKK